MTYNIFPKGALTHHLVVASCISFALPQAAGLTHSAAPPLPAKQALRGPFGGGTAFGSRALARRGASNLRFEPSRSAGGRLACPYGQATFEGNAASADAFQPISLREIGWAAGLRFTTERMASPCRRVTAPRQLRQETGHRQVSCLGNRGTRNDEGNGDDKR